MMDVDGEVDPTPAVGGVRSGEMEEISDKLSDANFVIDKIPFTTVKEGKAQIHFPCSNDVFYNPVQEFNRDISVAVIKEFSKTYSAYRSKWNRKDSKWQAYSGSSEVSAAIEESTRPESGGNNSPAAWQAGVQYEDGIHILEALAASGLRAIRYALEIPGVKTIVANDVSKQAVESIRRNVTANKVEHLITPNKEDAALFMYMNRSYDKRFDVVDLDPYGSPTPFLDGAVQSVQDGGLLLVTCTDLAVLCGNASETCHAKYGSISMKNKGCHEMALRIVLQCIESHANRYGRYIVPLLSLSVDFYVRLFVRIYTSQATVKKSASKLAMVYQCNGCETMTLQPLGKSTANDNGISFRHSPANGPTVGINCQHCGSKHKLGGPIWADRMHDKDFVQKLLEQVEENAEDFNTSKRIIGILNVVNEELPDVPLYYVLDRLHSIVHTKTPNMVMFRSALLNAGYRVSMSHASRSSIKTDAPPELLWDIVRAWAKENPGKRSFIENSPSYKILSKESSIQVSFDIHPDANPESRQKGLVRFQVNPEPNWGPKMKSKTSLQSGSEQDKSGRFQGKRSRQTSNGTGDLKRFPCKRFKQGKCKDGDNCRYLHSSQEESQVD